VSEPLDVVVAVNVPLCVQYGSEVALRPVTADVPEKLPPL
jgi:hypothetical protein